MKSDRGILGLLPACKMGILYLAIIILNSFYFSCMAQDQGALSVVVAPVKMNVFYLGLENPVEISAVGAKSEDIQVQVSNGIIKGSQGRYIVLPEKQGSETVTVLVNGKPVGTREFRVKMVPTPVAKVCGLRGGLISKELLLKQDQIEAVLENFDFNAPASILGFKLSVTVNGIDKEVLSKDQKITPEMKALIQQVEPGNKVYFEDIKVSLPDKTIRDLGSIILKLADKEE